MWNIPLFDISFDDSEFDAVQRVLESGWLTMGAVTQEFEHRFAEFLGVKHAIAVSSCTAALHLAHIALGIGAGDEVICPSLTFVAGPNSILYTGAKPVFAEVSGIDDFTISPADIEKKITPRTKAIQVMHYGGYTCNIDAIMEIAHMHNLVVVEDVAHAPGGAYKTRSLGTFGDVACFSFFSNKNLSTGEGGMVTTNDDELAEKVRLMRSHGMTTLTLDRHKGRAHSYDVVELGYNYRMDEIHAAIGIAQLAKLEQNNAKRATLSAQYVTLLHNVPGIYLPFQSFRHKSAYHIFPVLLDSSINRSQLIDDMKLAGIQTSIHYPPTHLFKYYMENLGCRTENLPITEDIARRELTLPLYPSLTSGQVDYVCEILEKMLARQL